MTTIYTLPIHLNKDIVFTRMHIDQTLPNYEEFDQAYSELAAELQEIVQARGIFVLKEAEAKGRICKELSEVSHLVYVMVTLGEAVSARSTRYFLEKDYLKGLMIDSMADQILFDASDDFYPIIRQEVYEKQGYALTVRFTPDDGRIPIHHQKLILDESGGKDLLNADVTEGFMYRPLKTMGYIYGADQNIQIAEKDHDCSLCDNLQCSFRKTASAASEKQIV